MMLPGLTFTIAERDDDYLGIEIQASNGRFSGSTYIYTGLDELSRFAGRIRGFPSEVRDERTVEFGSPDRSVAGGFVNLRFHCIGLTGRAAVEVSLEDDPHLSCGRVCLSISIEAAAIDRFAGALRVLERSGAGEAVLVGSD